MNPSASKPYIPFILIIISLGVYLNTICPTVYLGDSGEFTAAAFCLGIPHNSGYPVYALIGKLFCMIPIGNIGFRMNLMSVCFATITIWLVYSFILKITSSKLAAFVGGLILAFTPVLWSQTVCSEVYTLHTFFVALLIRLLWWWDQSREFFRLILLVFVTAISFGNHLQTVMLAPAVLFIVLSGDKKALLNVRHFLVLSVFFVLALLTYLYLPIRTGAGAAIHWGDPDNLERFLAHVTGRSHRHAYALTKTPLEYLSRAKETLLFVWSQFGVTLLLALWGWLKFSSVRWRVFFVMVIVFDFVYTIFLNIISLEITAFNLPTCIVLAILAGVGIAHVIRASKKYSAIGASTKRLIKIACLMIPVAFFFFNFGLCDQSRNYTAYEHAVNIFRTLDHGSTLFLDGDNNIFPAIYGRVVERMREDVTLFDRHNLFFKWSLSDDSFRFHGTWEEFKSAAEKRIIKEEVPHGVYFAVFNPYSISIPNQYRLIPYGILRRVVGDRSVLDNEMVNRIWYYYSKESFLDDFERDYMNREVCAYFYFNRGKYLYSSGQHDIGVSNIKLASRIGYNDQTIHSDIGVFLTDEGLFEEARKELQKALIYYDDLSVVHNNWGYYYNKFGDYRKAVSFFRKAIELRPKKPGYHNNLALSLYKSGRKKEAFLAFQKSLAINESQPSIHNFIEEHSLETDEFK